MKFLLHSVALALIVLGLAGCDSDGRTRPPPTSVRVLNAAPNYDALLFLREERPEAELPFGSGQTFRFDSDTYEFSIEVATPGTGERNRVATISRTVNEENEYNVIMTEAGGTPEMLFFPRPRAEGDTGMTLVHAAPDQGSVDIYLEPAGTDPATATPVATLAFRDSVIDESVPPGEYELILTAAGDPATVVFRSSTLVYDEATSALIVIANEGNRGLTPLAAFYMEDTVLRLNDPSRENAIRVINGASDMLARDIYIDDDFTTPIFTGVAFGTISAYVPLAIGTHDISVTPAGNPGVEEGTGTIITGTGLLYTTIIGGNSTDGVAVTTFLEDHRSFANAARVQLVNTAHEFDVLDIYVTAPGTDITLVPPIASLGPDGSNSYQTLGAGDYELTIRDRVNSTNVAGPDPLTLTNGTVQMLIVTDAVGGSTVDWQLIDDTP